MQSPQGLYMMCCCSHDLCNAAPGASFPSLLISVCLVAALGIFKIVHF
jgi:hypothetical protein